MNSEDILDSATTHTILREKTYFSRMKKAYVNTISSSTKLIEGSGRAALLLPGGTLLVIDNALYYSKSHRNLLSFKVIRQNGYHVETANEGKVEYLYITTINADKKIVHEKLPALYSGLYYTNICIVESHTLVNKRFTDSYDFNIWHDRLDHPGYNMMCKVIENSHGHTLKNQNVLQSKEFFFVACSQGMLVIKSSVAKVRVEFPAFLKQIQGDICGRIYPACGPFRYYMVLIDESTRCSHVCLL
ncbi:uncharacterized protein LOC107019595 [Solanum pennellii]|uniref:Uncharacterized protein LOC107019595 n=1 Tax=Solanum pennellii TaxID=28526 RepID=A0ABM1GSX8_SOLPN|nr:uncharacterized protein LOC107019595 [Solanum pennellii]